MRHSVLIRSRLGWLATLAIFVSGAFALAQQQGQPPRQGQGAQAQGGGGGGAQRASVAPLFLRANWVRPPSQTGQVPVVQENVGDPNVELKWYGPAAKKLLTSGNPGNPNAPFSVWSGECDGPFAITFRHKNSFADLTGLARIRWTIKTSGFHVVRPVVKLADGTLLVGDREGVSVPMLATEEFALADVRWIQLDPERAVTVNARAQGNPPGYIWVPNPDLSKVDEIGFADLMPASGHGPGGFIHLSEFEVYANPVPR